MKILQVVPTYLPARRYGGPIESVHGLCKALVARGHDVTVFTTNVDGDGVSDVPIDRPVVLDGVTVRYFPARVRRLYWSPAMRKALRGEVHHFDIAHLHSVFLSPTATTANECRRAGVPYVISPRGMLVEELIRLKSRVAKRSWLTLVERRNFAGAAGIHFTSRREWDDAAEVGLALPAPFIVPNGIDVSTEPLTPRDDKLLVFIGRINWKKGLDRLIEAMPMIRDARLEIAGNDEEQYEPRLRDLATKAAVADRVRFLGPVAGDEKEKLLRRAALFVLPSLSENFGNAVLEAMAAATPVVVTPEVGLASDITEARAGIVTSNEPGELAASINKLLSDPTEREAMGRRGRRLVSSRFTWPQVGAAMEREYLLRAKVTS